MWSLFYPNRKQTTDKNCQTLELEITEVTKMFSWPNLCLMLRDPVYLGMYFLAKTLGSHKTAHSISESVSLVAFAELKSTSLKL